jgi:hypothetical protein
MKKTLTLLAFVFTAFTTAHAQVAPAATMGAANVHYVFRYAETGEFGGTVGDWQTSKLSGELDYANPEERHPFRVNYAGGYTWTIAGPAYETGFFQHLLLSQGILWRKWTIFVSDDVSYMPVSPTSGFSGIPGIGEPIGEPNPNPPSSQSILTLNTHRVNNVASGEVSDRLNYATLINAGVASDLLRYPDGNGLDTDALTANGGVQSRLNARNSLSVNYLFSKFSYSNSGFNFVSNTATFGFKRVWNPKITTDVSAGPEWISSSDSTAVPSSTRIAVKAAVNYQFHLTTASLFYIRGVSGGSGYLPGGESDAVSGRVSRNFGRELNVGLFGSYRRLQGLQNSIVVSSKYGGAQVTRRFGQHISTFANYTVQYQSSSTSLPSNFLSGQVQEFSLGVTYTPRGTRLASH